MKTHSFSSRFESRDSRTLTVSIRYGDKENKKGYRPALVTIKDWHGQEVFRERCFLYARGSGFFLATSCQAGKRIVRSGVTVYAFGSPAYFVDMSGNGYDGPSIHLQTLARDYPFQIG